MARSFLPAACLAALLANFGLTQAHAQFGNIFGGPPRPPAGVGEQRQQQAPAPMGVPNQMPPEEMDDEDQPPPPPLQRPALPPARSQQRPQQQAAPQQQLPQQQQQGGFSSQPLAPPSGTAAAPQQQQQAVPGQITPGLAPGQTIPPVQQAAPGQRAPQTAARGTPAPSSAAPQPGDEVVVELPAQKIANPTAVFAGLDKVTGRITTFEVALNETVQFGALQVTPRVCYTRPPTETANTDTFAEVNEVTLQGEVKRIFAGWMFASSPGLHAVEHPIYDVWLTDCKGGTAPVADATPPAPTPVRTQTRTPAANTARPPQAAQNPAPVQQRSPVQQPTLQQPAPVGPPPGFR